ncbi:maleylacetoacetate isomerase [Psychromonas sp. MB-3u-54]|uniref:maleylacetoacetate isomerase n=1 Tax=Psychromonas sp. MB-3u-54 TaxID=2058319 RepID=UPI000C32EE92|nr:maleylacetoacetate isomerase [Psychromonas sp. MB-3u-54]PKH01931.1 maleylacetoacetate isomerase [Psychromonas sp. MB-3u-54]
MELYTYFRSSAAYRVRIALNIKEIKHTLIAVNLLEGEHAKSEYTGINPQGLVPSLKLDDGKIINQSTAILEYLEAEYPEIPLLPNDSFTAATIRNWSNIIACDIHPLDNLRVLKYLTNELNVNADDKMSWYHHWIIEGFTALETQLLATPYCFGTTVTLADVYLIPMVYNALRFNLSMEKFPKILAIYEACNTLEGFDRAKPENQADCKIA